MRNARIRNMIADARKFDPIRHWAAYTGETLRWDTNSVPASDPF